MSEIMLPDPYVRFGRYNTVPSRNTLTPSWNEIVAVQPRSTLGDGIPVSLLDEDSPATDDVICPVQVVRFTPEDFSAGRKTISCGETTITFALWPR